MQIDIRVMELLASKLCHDLVSPVSAINNGVELIEDIGGSVIDEAMKLIGDSGITASRRLRLYRMAYGRAGSEESLGAKDVRQVAEHYLTGGKMSLVWADSLDLSGFVETRGYFKTLLNLIVLAEESLAYGGVITLHSGEAGRRGCWLEIMGRNAHLSPAHQQALDGVSAIEDLTPRSIHAYVTGRFAAQFGLDLRHNQVAEGQLEFSLTSREVPQSVVNVS